MKTVRTEIKKVENWSRKKNKVKVEKNKKDIIINIEEIF